MLPALNPQVPAQATSFWKPLMTSLAPKLTEKLSHSSSLRGMALALPKVTVVLQLTPAHSQ
ncbi:hypothetical protein PF003_g820 [Phytophthora fragariae]|nr:hypothetical protein PF003_g820 [Phytophthora fragariae]